MKKLISTIFMTLLAVFVFAGGAPEQETEVFLSQPPQYISPGNPATGKDVLKIENIQISIGDNVSVQRYELRVYNKRGEIIYSVADENLEGRGFFDEIFDVGEHPSVTIPESMFWDGRDSGSNFVEDGEYFYQLYVRDSNDRQASTAPLSVVVDRAPPEVVSLTSSLLIFSPNDDGKQDSVSFFIQTGPAESWDWKIGNASGTILNDSRVSEGDTAASDVLAPSQFDWDGKNTSGTLQGEGEYQFLLEGRDRAGNIVRETVEVVLSSAAANIELSSTSPYLLPPPAGLDISVSVNITEGLESWKLEILDEEDIVFRRFSGNVSSLPTSIVFDGKGNPGRPEGPGVPMEDGVYRAVFSAEYSNGNVSFSAPLAVILDDTAPAASLAADSVPLGHDLGNPLYFGGSSRPRLSLDANYEENIDWDIVVVYQSKDETVIPLKTFLEAGFSFPFVWDGTDPATGRARPDGAYQVFLRTRDTAGNEGTSDIARFIKDTASRAGTGLALSMPEADAIRITPIVPIIEGIEHFIVNIVNEGDGRIYYTRQVRQRLSYLSWNGRGNNNAPAPLGKYRVELDILYFNGDNTIVQSAQRISLGPDGLRIDSGGLQGRITLDGGLFSPDGDGVNDTVSIGLDIGAQSPVRWDVEILDPYGNFFRKWEGTGLPPGEIVWDGFSDDGVLMRELVQSAADYTVVFALEDEAGNREMTLDVITTDILIIVDGDRLKIRVPSIYFAPNTPDLFDVGVDEQRRNFDTLQRLAEILNLYENHSITIEGHAVQILSGALGQREQRNTLLPLSQARALEVKQALSILGVDWQRMTEKGYGGSLPVVPHADAENRWKNRRVEFILDRL